MHTFGSQLAGYGFRKNPLRGLGRREPRKAGFASKSGGIAARDDSTLSRRDHRRCYAPREIQQRHRVYLKVLIQDFRIDFHEVAERTADRIVDQYLGRAEFGAYRIEGGVQLRFIRDIALIRMRVRNLPLERCQAIAISREHRDRVSAASEAPRDRRASSRTYPGHDCNWILLIHQRIPSSIGCAVPGFSRTARPRLRRSQAPRGSSRCPLPARVPSCEP